MKLAIIVGTRPELIKLSSILKKLTQYFDITLIHTGQNYDVNLDEIFYSDLDIKKPDYYLNCNDADLGRNIGNVISRSYTLLEKIIPDAVLILGDTNSALSAYSAKRLKIPIFHMEAGNRCFDENVPEELNRKIVDHISDINLPYTQIAKRYLEIEGVAPKKIIVTGSPMQEVISDQWDKIKNSQILRNMKIGSNQFILLSTHRAENVDNKEMLRNSLQIIDSIGAKYNLPVIFPCHPRTQKNLKDIAQNLELNNIKVIDPQNFSDFVKLQITARIVLSDSGTLSEEASILNFPAINIRYTHERPEAFEEGVVPFHLPTDDFFTETVEFVMSREQKNIQKVLDYSVGCVSQKIANIIFSYTPYVNKFIWRKI